jgi:uncharacterized protein (TIGR02996 family)
MSSERDALLAAICADPEDDTPRLVFADWLDENGSPAWAELIRVECELARLANDGSGAEAVFRFLNEHEDQAFRGVRWDEVDPEIGRRIELTLQAKRVRPKARHDIFPLMPRNAGLWWLRDTHRGFPATLYVTRKNNVDPAAITQLPPFHLSFGHVTEEPEEDVRRWVAGGLLRRVRELSLPADRSDLLPEFGTSPTTSGIRSFSLVGYGGSGGQDVLVRWLTATGNWAGLRALDIGGGEGLSRGSAVELFRAKSLRKLTLLRIHGGEWTRHTVRELNNFTELRELALHECGLDDSAAEALANMPGLRNLRSLTLRGNRIGGRGATALLTSPHLADLALLDLENNEIRGLDPKALAAAPPAGLRLAAFDSNRLTLADVGALAASPRLSNLVYLDLDYNHLADSAAARLVKGFGGNAPAILYLLGNRLGAGAARALAAWEGASRVHMLHLRWNPLDTPAAKILAGCPHFTRLRHLCASLPTAGEKALKKRFGKKADV